VFAFHVTWRPAGGRATQSISHRRESLNSAVQLIGFGRKAGSIDPWRSIISADESSNLIQ